MQIHPLSCGLGMAFLIEDETGLLLIDSGSPGQQQQVIKKMAELGRTDLKQIWITHAHYDHYGSAAALREITGARIGVHPADAASIIAGQSPLGSSRSYGWFYPYAQRLANRIYPLGLTTPDFTLEDGEAIEGFSYSAVIIHTPGHTPGHTCLLLAGEIIFAADLIARSPRPRMQSLLATDWSLLPSSLKRIQSLQPKWVYTGHSRYKMPGMQLTQIHP